jgi:acetyl esterase/lipase
MGTKPMELIKPDETRIYSSPDGHDLEMHVFRPAPEGDNVEHKPSIVFIHGGGFVNGNPSQFFWHAKAAADSGYVACSIAYRLSGIATFPAALIDCQNAVAFLRKNARELGLDVNRIASFGSSAGGYLAAFLGVTDVYRGVADNPDFSPQVEYVVNVHGPADMRIGPPAAEYRTKFMGVSIDEDPEAYRVASPIEYVSNNTSPMLLIHDPKDEVVDFEQSLLLSKRLEANDVEVELHRVSDTNHGFIYNPNSEKAREAYKFAEKWLSLRIKSPS